MWVFCVVDKQCRLERPGDRREAYLSTQCPTSCQDARLSRSHEHPRWTCCPQVSSCQGSNPPVGLIDSIRDRDVFVRLGRDGARFRLGALWCSFLPQPDKQAASVAFAIGRSVGPAVVRNRLRRRLRSIVRELELTPGWWLIGARPGVVELTYAEIRESMTDLAVKVAHSNVGTR